MKSMEEMMAAAQKAAETIQSQMGDAQAKLDSIEVEGTAGGGLVTVKCTARGRILGVSIDESLMKPEEKQMVEDLVAAAADHRLQHKRDGGRSPSPRHHRDASPPRHRASAATCCPEPRLCRLHPASERCSTRST